MDIKEYTTILTINLATLSINLTNVNLLLQIALTAVSLVYVGYKLFRKIKDRDE